MLDQWSNIYQATVENSEGGTENYVGLAADFKVRFYKHRHSLEVQSADNSTTLSTHYWNEVGENRSPKVTWRILEKDIPTFNPITGICKLCIREKYNIVFRPQLATLNLRHEIFSSCRHKEGKLLIKAPD